MLRNYYLHAVREISGYWDQIVIPELAIDEPAYRISLGGNSVGLNGHAEVLAMYPRRGRDRPERHGDDAS